MEELKKVNNLQEAWKLCKNILLEAQINVCQTSKRPAAWGKEKKKKNKPGMTNWQSERSCFREKDISHKTEASAGEVHQVW